jgi:hypothetical protein
MQPTKLASSSTSRRRDGHPAGLGVTARDWLSIDSGRLRRILLKASTSSRQCGGVFYLEGSEDCSRFDNYGVHSGRFERRVCIIERLQLLFDFFSQVKHN